VKLDGYKTYLGFALYFLGGAMIAFGLAEAGVLVQDAGVGLAGIGAAHKFAKANG
jgi:hypothetical protein